MIRRILLTGFVIGCLDGIAACVNVYFSYGMMPGQLFRHIASGFYGIEAYSGGFMMVQLGLLIHFFIATIVTATFFVLDSKLFFIRKNYLFYGAAYGILVWITMNLIVIPLSAVASSSPSGYQITIGLMIHIFIIGIPVAYSVENFFNKKRSSWDISFRSKRPL